MQFQVCAQGTDVLELKLECSSLSHICGPNLIRNHTKNIHVVSCFILDLFLKLPGSLY